MSGHRITITYILYVSEQIGGVMQRSPTVDASLFPLFQGPKQMVEDEKFKAQCTIPTIAILNVPSGV